MQIFSLKKEIKMRNIKYFIVIITNLLVITACNFFAVGSYPYAEYYKFDMTRDSLIRKMNQFKDENPQYKVFTTDQDNNIVELSVGVESYGFWCVNYNIGNDSTILCVINMSDQIKEKPTYLGFVGFSTKKNFGNWKDINTKELSRKENKFIKKKFEKDILDKLGDWK